MLAQNDVHGDDQARRARRVDLRVLRRLGAELHVLHRALHNAIGRFYEVQSYGPDPYEVRPGATTTSKEWFRPNPPLPFIKWGPRNNTNIQQSALLFSLSHVAKNKELYLENYWLKNKRAVDKGEERPDLRLGDSRRAAPQGRRRRRGQRAAAPGPRDLDAPTSRSRPATSTSQAGDYIVRGDQPFRTLADMYFSIQNYPPQNPSPYDDTGWTFQLHAQRQASRRSTDKSDPRRSR